MNHSRLGGFELISDEELRNDIIRFYENYIRSQVAFIQNRNNALEPPIRDLHRQLTQYVSEVNPKEDAFQIRLRPNDDDMLNNQRFLELMSYEESKADNQRVRTEAIVRRTSELKEKIDNYLAESR